MIKAAIVTWLKAFWADQWGSIIGCTIMLVALTAIYLSPNVSFGLGLFLGFGIGWLTLFGTLVYRIVRNGDRPAL